MLGALPVVYASIRIGLRIGLRSGTLYQAEKNPKATSGFGFIVSTYKGEDYSFNDTYDKPARK